MLLSFFQLAMDAPEVFSSGKFVNTLVVWIDNFINSTISVLGICISIRD